MNHYEQTTQEVRNAFNALCKGRVEAAVKAEREACAKVCDVVMPGDEYLTAVINSFADTIRARGQA